MLGLGHNSAMSARHLLTRQCILGECEVLYDINKRLVFISFLGMSHLTLISLRVGHLYKNREKYWQRGLWFS